MFRLTESETKTTMNMFADHTGVIIDPFGTTSANLSQVVSDMYGIRISPKQSPFYQRGVRLYYSFFLSN